jgi:hypothetical protein
MKFAYIALIAAVSAAEDAAVSTAGTFTLGAKCLGATDNMGCVEGHKCAVVPACDATCETAKATAQTKANEALAKEAAKCDADPACNEKADKARDDEIAAAEKVAADA